LHNQDILERPERPGYLLRPPAHTQCRRRHLGADVQPPIRPFWPACSRRGIALAHVRHCYCGRAAGGVLGGAPNPCRRETACLEIATFLLHFELGSA
jgi:hypothetical protein